MHGFEIRYSIIIFWNYYSFSWKFYIYIDRWNYGTITLHVDMGFLIWCQILHASCYGEILHKLNKKIYFTGTEIFLLWKFLLISTFCCNLLAEERLMKELEAAREARRAVEKQREELVKKAKLMQTKTQNRRNHGKIDRSHFWLELFLGVLLLCNPCVNLPKLDLKGDHEKPLIPKFAWRSLIFSSSYFVNVSSWVQSSDTLILFHAKWVGDLISFCYTFSWCFSFGFESCHGDSKANCQHLLPQN